MLVKGNVENVMRIANFNVVEVRQKIVLRIVKMINIGDQPNINA